MRVKYSAEIFSHTFASFLVQASHNQAKSKCGRYQMGVKGEDTGYLCLFLDQVFDSVNGTVSKETNDNESIYKKPIPTKGDCPHEELWNSAIRVFESMRYVKSRKNDYEKPPVLINWVKTLKSFKVLREKMAEYGFETFSGRLFNQDPLENFFSQIKQHGARNIKPNCIAFSSYFKTLLLNSLADNNLELSNSSNCERDYSSSLLIDIESLMSSGTKNASYRPWNLPNLPPDCFARESIDDETITFFQKIISEKLLNIIDLDCVCCYSNLLNVCNYNVGPHFCDGTLLSHVAYQVHIICKYFFPRVSHQVDF